MSKETNENRRRINQLLGLAVGGGIVSAFADGYIWQESQENAGSQREITRGTLDREELDQIEDCFVGGSRDLRGVTEYIDELLDEEEGDTLTEIEYVFDEAGSPRDTGSSFRYSVQLENGDEYTMGWYDAENSIVEHFAEASKYQDMSDYEEENC